MRKLLNYLSRTYILHQNLNPMWNDGSIHVYVKGKSVETIDVDEFMSENRDEDIWGANDIIDMLKKRYRISRVKTMETNWR